tara:strand:- start:7270 stop:8229 length:960 start_codon:yes stop_codon:yes gene_type:complete
MSPSPPLALIIGSDGQDGVLLSALLRNEGWTVVAMGRRMMTLPDGSEKHGVDITNSASIGQFIAELRPTHIFYLAAYNGSTERRSQISYVDSVSGCLSVNLTGFANVLSGASKIEQRPRILYAASSHAFGIPDDVPQNEMTAFRPLTPYGITKAAGVRLCASYRHNAGMFVAAAILYNHESPLRSQDYITQKIATAAAAAARGSRAKIQVRSLSSRVDWGAAEDYVAAMALILQQDVPDDYIVASGQAHSVADFAQIAYDRVGLDWKEYVEEYPNAVVTSGPELVGDATKLKRLTGWQPKHSFNDLVFQMVDAALARQP